MSRLKILLTGAGGQVGWELQRTLAPLGEVLAVDHQQMDLADPQQIRDFVRASKPSLIVNPAAYTAVDKAEQEPQLAHAINAVAPQVLAEEARLLGCGMIHYSTDYVYDGSKGVPYLETDTTNPLNVYGASKLAGDLAVAESGADYLVLRTSWVYGARGANFLRTILRLAAEREELKIVADQIGAPTWSRMIAEATAAIVAQCYGVKPTGLAPFKGVYHLTNAGQTSWHGFTEAILALTADFASSQGRKLQRVLPIPTSEYPLPAKRTQYSVLSNDKLATTFGIALPDWRASLAAVVESLN